MSGRKNLFALGIAVLVIGMLAASLPGCASLGASTSAYPTPTPMPVGGGGVKTIYLAGGCFWGTQKYVDYIHGVVSTEVGYANGSSKHATYEDGSGYAETVKVTYDPAVAPLPFLLRTFYKAIDPTSIDQQGNDVGVEYRSGVYYTDPADLPVIRASLAQLQKQYSSPIAIEVGPLKTYTKAEDYHQKYLQKNPEGYCHIPLQSFKDAAAARPLPSDFPTASVVASTSALPNDATLRKTLTPEQYAVTQQRATEPAFHNAYWNTYAAGIYVDIVTGKPLFAASAKFNSGCGWPSFSKPIDQSLIKELPDDSWGMQRTEVRSTSSGSHLGHVFDDGPKSSGGLRYCVNSAALRFVPRAHMVAEGYAQFLNLAN